MTVDLYDILGVDHDAGQRDIKRAFRRLAKEYHPDRNPGDPDAEQKFKEALAAFEILSDPDQRRRYDRFGFDGLESPEKANFDASSGEFGGGDEPWWAAGTDVDESVSEIFGEDSFDFSYFEEIGDFDFSDAFEPGEGFGVEPPSGGDVEQTVEVGLLEALRGTELDLEVDGETVRIRLEEGVATGDRLRVPGGGRAAPEDDGNDGDLLLDIEVLEHSVLERAGLDLAMEVPVTVVEATLGASIEIPSPWGPLELEVPAGVDSGDRLRLEGQGVRRQGERGDLFVEVAIVTPEALEADAAAALERLEAAYDGGVRDELTLR